MERAILVGKGPVLMPEDLGLISSGSPQAAAGGTSGASVPGPALTPEGIDLPSLMESIERRYLPGGPADFQRKRDAGRGRSSE